ncbi:MAG: trp operon repressor [Treponemataceae bacterium]|nr:trp operon repressor [Treponemataceae bacterium]
MKDNEKDDGILETCYSELLELIAGTTDADFLRDFFGCLFTAAERKDFSERWLLVKEISAGTTQREIARKFNLSLCKITRGSRELRKEHSAFRAMLKKLEEP